MRALTISILLLTISGLTGCNLIYKQSIQQGNAIEQEELDKVDLGMTKRQVNLIMGTPAVQDPFHKDRWDYVYEHRPRGNDGNKRIVTIIFEKDEVIDIIGLIQNIEEWDNVKTAVHSKSRDN
ncbi:MAG: outer membrane protein assembly factor BamE [Xanthomonadales bacterium]|nr:outer membrane protein assembly factor BamE [Xanthomonadales bacterium]